MLWNDYQNKLTSFIQKRYQKREIEKTLFFPLAVRTLGIYSLNNFQISQTAVLATLIMLYMTSSVLYFKEVCTFWPEFPVLLIKKVGCFSLNSLSFCSSRHCQHSPAHRSPSPPPFWETDEQWVPFQEVGTKWWNWSSPSNHTLL